MENCFFLEILWCKTRFYYGILKCLKYILSWYLISVTGNFIFNHPLLHRWLCTNSIMVPCTKLMHDILYRSDKFHYRTPCLRLMYNIGQAYSYYVTPCIRLMYDICQAYSYYGTPCMSWCMIFVTLNLIMGHTV